MSMSMSKSKSMSTEFFLLLRWFDDDAECVDMELVPLANDPDPDWSIYDYVMIDTSAKLIGISRDGEQCLTEMQLKEHLNKYSYMDDVDTSLDFEDFVKVFQDSGYITEYKNNWFSSYRCDSIPYRIFKRGRDYKTQRLDLLGWRNVVERTARQAGIQRKEAICKS